MAGIFRLTEIQAKNETNFAENAESAGSQTYTKRYPVTSYNLTLSHPRMADMGLRSRTNEEALSHPGIRGATLDIESYLYGHLTTCSGALVQTQLHEELSTAFGGSDVAEVGTTLSAATTASSFTLTSTTGWAAGKIGRIGVKGDGKGDGQAFIVNAVGPPTTSLVALPATPANGDVVYAMQLFYHDESKLNTLTSKAFQCGYSSTPTSGEQFHLFGCQLSKIVFSFPFGGLPKVKRTYQAAYWQQAATTIPSASPTISDQFCAPTAGGSIHLADIGTATRTTFAASSLDISIDLGLEPIISPGGNGTYQNVTGWVRSKAQPTVTMVTPFTTAFQTWWDTANQSLVSKNMLFTSNGIDARSVAAWFPNLMPVGDRPIQPVNSNNQTYVKVVMRGRDNLSGSNELTKAAMVMALG